MWPMRFMLILLVSWTFNVTQLVAQPKVAGDPARLERIKTAKMPAIWRSRLTPETDAILAALKLSTQSIKTGR